MAWHLALSIAAIYCWAMIFGSVASTLRSRLPIGLRWGLALVPFACPLIIPASFPMLRALSAFVAADCTFKLVDYLSKPRLSWTATAWRDYVIVLVPFPALLIVYPEHRQRLKHPDRPLPHIARIIIGTSLFVVALILVKRLEQAPMLRESMLITHLTRVAIFIPAIEAMSQVLFAFERLAGYDTKPLIHNMYLARTIGDFWRRYNCRVHDWLVRHIFSPSGGRKHPLRAILIVFAFSGLFHEIAFAIATSQLTGYQFAFFAIQGPAAIASGYLDQQTRRFGVVGSLISHTFTIVFLVATSVLFFDGVCRVFPNILDNGSPLT